MAQAMALEPTPTRTMTIAEWAAMDEDEPGELVDGVLVEEEVPEYVHELIVGWLIRILGVWAAPRGAFVAGSGAKFAVAPRRGRMPDLTVFFGGGRLPPRRGPITIPPDIAVEIVSPTPRDGRRDRIDKHREYAAFGVRFYWILDPEARTLEVLELGPDGRYIAACLAANGTVTEVPGCDGLTIDLDDLWAQVDRLGPEPEAEKGR
jgi:Uma2 family endonuclease